VHVLKEPRAFPLELLKQPPVFELDLILQAVAELPDTVDVLYEKIGMKTN
jgi:hypothetical protein